MTDTLLRTQTSTTDAPVAVVDASAWTPRPWNTPAPTTAGDVEAIVTEAALAARDLPVEVDAALVDFADHSHPSGAILLRGIDVGDLPPTPTAPDEVVDKDATTELALLTVARRMGQPVGYGPEHGGRIVQNLVPTAATADLQMSTSSRSNLLFHTETAFHPHRPRHLALLCLRGNPEAHTTLASIDDIVARLPAETVEIMRQPRFRTSVDASFLDGRMDEYGEPHVLLSGTDDEPTFVFDADLTIGIDADAERVVHAVTVAIEAATTSVVLEPGDLLLIDNNRAVHGRSPFTARFDGTDRWLQRAFIVADLAPSASDRSGRVITTEFGRLPDRERREESRRES